MSFLPHEPLACSGNLNSPSQSTSLQMASLFTGAGIGDLGFRAAGLEMLATCELEHDRAALTRLNYPRAKHFVGDISAVHDEMVNYLTRKIDDVGEPLFLISCTAPCQGMSKSGQGTLLRNIKRGKRPQLDVRNRLILPALSIIRQVRPLWVVFENVMEMRNTLIEDVNGQLRPILNIIDEYLEPDYVGKAYDIEVADYGVPQRRQRLITVYTRHELAKKRFSEGVEFIPARTHSKKGTNGSLPWVSVANALKAFPPLDAKTARTAQDTSLSFHRVPVLDAKKYEWISNTPPGASAFDNQCINPSCLFQENRTHGSAYDEEGVKRSLKDTPIYCERCGHLLPRPYTDIGGGFRRIMSGYTSAYKRMHADRPAPTLTRNLSYPCSDHKIHPTQNRVLSLAEAMRLQTISDYDYRWGPIELLDKKGRQKVGSATDGLIRLVIGESVPPKFIELLADHIKQLSSVIGDSVDFRNEGQIQLAML